MKTENAFSSSFSIECVQKFWVICASICFGDLNTCDFDTLTWCANYLITFSIRLHIKSSHRRHKYSSLQNISNHKLLKTFEHIQCQNELENASSVFTEAQYDLAWDMSSSAKKRGTLILESEIDTKPRITFQGPPIFSVLTTKRCTHRLWATAEILFDLRDFEIFTPLCSIQDICSFILWCRHVHTGKRIECTKK